MITRKDIAAHLERSIRTGFLLGGKGFTPLRAAFAREVPSDGAFESYTDMGATPWPVMNSGKLGAGGTDTRTGKPIMGAINTGGPVTASAAEEQGLIVYNADWEITIPVTHNAIDDDKVGDIEAWARDAARNFERHKDQLCFFALNSGDGVVYGTCYDSLSLFNDAHIDPGAAYQTAQDNKYALALSLDNFETVRVAASNFLDGRGNPIGYSHGLLIVPPALERLAAQITANKEDYATADRKINPYAGNVRSLVAPGGWLDSTAWIVVDTTQTQKPINLQLRKEPDLVIWDDEKAGDGGVRYFKMHARYQVFYGDWRLAIMGQT